MFTGIVRDKGRVKYIRGNAISVSSRMEDLNTGGSLMVDGVCLTITKISGGNIIMDIGRETLAKTSLGKLKAGAYVNLEPAMKMTDRIDGHIVYGHVLGIGRVASVKHKKNTIIILVKAAGNIVKKLLEKGSVALNGVSLTVNEINGESFKVGIVPETAKRTNLGSLNSGSIVNIEPDMIIAAAKG
ncbi:MAG: riboflavin synthase [Elusimicrobia bacterium]|jgi:riboflavin synthase|nr:riboflavin synthase [Elusimicrobiota bacterium]